MNIIHVASNSSFVEMVERLKGCEFLAIDTEFMRVDTFYPQLALLQIGDGQHEYLIDPLLVTDFSPLFPLLLNEYPRKILHACSEDVEVLTRLIGGRIKGLLDTQIAASFMGQGLQIGYQKALLDNLGVDIPKGESRSDWLQRPLSESQINYAALDVKYLPPLYEKLKAGLQKKSLDQWFEQDCQLMLNDFDFSPDSTVMYRDVSNAWRLDRKALAVLKELLVWREREARERDMPRGFLIKNSSLTFLAKQQPSSLQTLSDIPDITPRILRKEGQKIVDVIAEAQKIRADEWPEPLPAPLPREAKGLYDQLKTATKPVAEKTGVPDEVLLRKRHIEALVLGRVDQGSEAALPVAFQGWRGELLLPVIEPVLAANTQNLLSWQQERRRSVEAKR